MAGLRVGASDEDPGDKGDNGEPVLSDCSGCVAPLFGIGSAGPCCALWALAAPVQHRLHVTARAPNDRVERERRLILSNGNAYSPDPKTGTYLYKFVP